MTEQEGGGPSSAAGGKKPEDRTYCFQFSDPGLRTAAHEYTFELGSVCTGISSMGKNVLHTLGKVCSFRHHREGIGLLKWGSGGGEAFRVLVATVRGEGREKDVDDNVSDDDSEIKEHK